MTPVEVQVLLHCYYCAEKHPRSETAAVRLATAWLEANELIELDKFEGYYKTTEKGDALVSMVCNTLCRWSPRFTPTRVLARRSSRDEC